MTLRKLTAPPYWSRWAVNDLGIVEKRGGSSLWYALDSQGRIVKTMCTSRADAVSALKQ